MQSRNEHNPDPNDIWFDITVVAPWRRAALIEETACLFPIMGAYCHSPAVYGPADNAEIHICLGMEFHNLINEIKNKLSQTIGDDDILSFSAIKRKIEKRYDKWKKYFLPLKIGKKWIISPPWASENADKNRTLILIQPGEGFGTGAHPTTRFILEWIETLQNPPPAFLDVGAGSGILSIALLKAGCQTGVAIEQDKAAVLNALENLKLNNLHSKLHLFHCALQTWKSHRTFPLIVANLDCSTFKKYYDFIDQRLDPGGSMVLSGILKIQLQELMKTWKNKRKITHLTKNDEWVALVLK